MRTNRNRIEVHGRFVHRFPLHARDQRDLALVARRHRAARAAGLPVPAVIEVDTSGPDPYMVMERAGGTPLMETELPASAQRRLGAEVAAFVRSLRAVEQWFDTSIPDWPRLWQVLAQVAPTTECILAAQTAADAPLSLVHGDLSAGNLLVTADGQLTAVIDWDGAALADVALDWAALCANCPPAVVSAMREATADAGELQRRAQIYLATWPVQHDLWESGDHPWLSGDVPLAEPRM
jgi:aminoglycoside phosphotransferase (APT) family kinase protein